MKKGKNAKKEARAKRTEHPAEILQRLFSSMGKDRERTYRYQLLVRHWADIVGEAAAAHVRPVRMDFRRLFLAADAPVWANELRYMERQIIDKINAFVCGELVTKIVFCAPCPEYFSRPRRATKEEETPREILSPLRAEREKSISVAEGVGDGALRQAAARAFAQHLALRRARIEARWHACPSCGRLAPPEEKLCSFCAREKRKKVDSAIRCLLLGKPWMRDGEIANIVGCSRDAVPRARSALLQDLASRVKKGDGTGEDAQRLVMMFASIEPESLTGEIMKKTLDRLRFDLLPGEDMPAGKEKAGKFPPFRPML